MPTFRSQPTAVPFPVVNAILYQIAVMIAICTAVTCACFGALIFGSRTLIDEKTQTIRPLEDPLT